MKKLFLKYFIHTTNIAHVQFLRYLFVGGISTLIDIAIFYIFNSMIYLDHYLFAQTAGFLAGLALNYLLSIKWVFQGGGNIIREFTLFAIIGIGGLLLSYLILWLLIDFFDLTNYENMLAKSIAVILVLVWNFGMRKKFVF